MKPTPIAFSPTSSSGERPQTSSAKMVNAIAEQLEDGRILVKRAPGLKTIARSDEHSHCRGIIRYNNNLSLVVYDEIVYGATGTALSPGGTLDGSDLVTLARNNASTPDVVVVCDAGAFTISSAGAVSSYPDGDVGSPNSVCFTGGYFFFTYGDGSCIASGLNSTSINTLDSIKAESRSLGLLRGVAHRGQLFLCGPASIEVWSGDQTNPTGFPFNLLTVIETGLMAKFAIAGFEDQFTPSLIWAAPTNHIYMLKGYEPFKISTPSIERDLENLVNKNSLRAFACAHQGHQYVVFKCNDWTHVYDLSTSSWQERNSYGYPRWRGECSAFINGDWWIGDEFDGSIRILDSETQYEGENQVVWDVESQVTEFFPMTRGVKRADFNFALGTTTPGDEGSINDDPKVLIYWSDDGGTNWSRPLERSLGKAGRFSNLVTVKRCGQIGHHGRKWRVRVSDPVFMGLFGGTMWTADS